MDIKPLITAEEIDSKLAELGRQITGTTRARTCCWLGFSVAPSW